VKTSQMSDHGAHLKQRVTVVEGTNGGESGQTGNEQPNLGGLRITEGWGSASDYRL